jgi:hypothetical protein
MVDRISFDDVRETRDHYAPSQVGLDTVCLAASDEFGVQIMELTQYSPEILKDGIAAFEQELSYGFLRHFFTDRFNDKAAFALQCLDTVPGLRPWKALKKDCRTRCVDSSGRLGPPKLRFPLLNHLNDSSFEGLRN